LPSVSSPSFCFRKTFRSIFEATIFLCESVSFLDNPFLEHLLVRIYGLNFLSPPPFWIFFYFSFGLVGGFFFVGGGGFFLGFFFFLELFLFWCGLREMCYTLLQAYISIVLHSYKILGFESPSSRFSISRSPQKYRLCTSPDIIFFPRPPPFLRFDCLIKAFFNRFPNAPYFSHPTLDEFWPLLWLPLFFSIFLTFFPLGTRLFFFLSCRLFLPSSPSGRFLDMFRVV